MTRPAPIPLYVPVTAETYDEAAYLASNRDVAAAVAAGHLPGGRTHFDAHGHAEGRLQANLVAAADVAGMRAAKMDRLRPRLRGDLRTAADGVVDSLSEADRVRFGVIDTDNVSAHEYDAETEGLIARHAGGLVLDCGAGSRPRYLPDVVNYEIVRYPSTDVVGVAERLPFADDTFDAVISLAVLEHVKYPAQAAKELARVLKPGGELHCVVPFLQPLHGYPNHYFNMTHAGLRSLFEDDLEIVGQNVPDGCAPVFTLTWMLQRWAAELPEGTRADFEAMTVADLTAAPTSLWTEPFCTELPEAARFELASATRLRATKAAR